MLYGKKILKQYDMTINSMDMELFILDDDEYFNIHILDDIYSQNKLNTLKLQEPKEYVKLEELDDIFCQTQLIEHYLWHKNYGYKGKSYSFCVTMTDECELDLNKE